MSVLDWLHRAPPMGRIAPLGSEHADRLAAIHADAFTRPWSPLDFERLLADRAVCADGLFVGRRQDPAGFALSRIVADEAEILTLAIAPPARRKGYGRLLLERHIDELARAGARVVHLEVEEGNGPALALYRRLAFAEIGRRAGYYLKPDGTRHAALTMSRTL